MPLPAALLARLSKRGIVEAKPDTKTSTKPEEVEEVFAEDYDDPSRPENVSQPEPEPPQPQPLVPAPIPQAVLDIAGDGPIFFDTTACPNRLNPYHECLAYCRKRYGMREWDPDDDVIRRRDRMLRKYPLPSGWVEVGDYDTGRYYYWNVNTDEVSWLSPSHPKAQVTRSAEALGLVGKIGNLDSDGEEPMETVQEEAETDSGSDTSLSDEEDFIDKRGRVRDRGRVPELRKGHKREELDPMDPASYSDIPRGGWTDGLDTRGKAKTGVDVTASGPLFQQRPYPSPGDILRANQTLKKKK
ncbi:polyglutamine-binding protein 1 [Aplysia californica]|uniref:Polyglutamine-binding protein 1 n=1 Tax=Aplysia californica TaxID=6500 RepID=A0ABM0JGU6_APLCA|nr:polyglutamine-binding protein 1 [Aplysia californica]